MPGGVTLPGIALIGLNAAYFLPPFLPLPFDGAFFGTVTVVVQR